MTEERQFKNAMVMDNIEKYFGNVTVLKGVSFEVGANESGGINWR